jgi:chromosome segregation ATPase
MNPWEKYIRTINLPSDCQRDVLDVFNEQKAVIVELTAEVRKKENQLRVCGHAALKRERLVNELIQQKRELDKEHVELHQTLESQTREMNMRNEELKEAKAKMAQMSQNIGKLQNDLVKKAPSHPRKKRNVVDVYKSGEKKKKSFSRNVKVALPFKCHRFGCYKSFDKVRSLQRHLLRHQNEYTCDICNRRFSQLSDIKRHMGIHTGEKFHCDRCGSSFAQRGNLQRHKKGSCIKL